MEAAIQLEKEKHERELRALEQRLKESFVMVCNHSYICHVYVAFLNTVFTYMSFCYFAHQLSRSDALVVGGGVRNFYLTLSHVSHVLCKNGGIKHDFPFINIRKVPREVLKTEGEAIRNPH